MSKAKRGSEALEILKKEVFELAILDVMMPGMDGFEVLKRINSEYNYLPVIMLTARSDDMDKIVGLELGADDYIIKPFNPRELLARIKAVTRRQEKGKKDNEEIIITSDLIQLDMNKRQAVVRGQFTELTSAEFEILSILLQNKGIVLSREKIMDLARGRDFMAFDRSIDVHISHLRQKIEDDPKNPILIKTVWGIGYIYTGE